MLGKQLFAKFHLEKLIYNKIYYNVIILFFIQDETLFGPPARLKQMTGNRSWGGSSAPDLSPSLGGGSSQVGGSKKKARGRGRRMSNDPEVVQVITKDLIRKIRFTHSYNLLYYRVSLKCVRVVLQHSDVSIFPFKMWCILYFPLNNCILHMFEGAGFIQIS